MTMKLVKRLYNRGQKMSTRQVLDTNDLTLKLTAQQHDLKEVWRKTRKHFSEKLCRQNMIMQMEIYVIDSANHPI